jgi:phosphoglycerol transferase MdoB-like AlkP superfamily enzyme
MPSILQTIPPRNQPHHNAGTYFFLPLVFFAAALAVLTCLRFLLIANISASGLTFTDFLPALPLGAKVDARWLAVFLLPAWIVWSVPFARKSARFFAALFAGFAMFALTVLTILNIGFFQFNGEPISPMLFGLFQEDSKEIFAGLWRDWPILKYMAAGIPLALVPFAPLPFVWRFLTRNDVESSPVSYGFCFLLLSLFLALFIRGSAGTAPLGASDFAVSPIPTVNDAAHNGASALAEAFKDRGRRTVAGPASAALAEAGFARLEEAQEILDMREARMKDAPLTLEKKPHIVFALMESMGKDVFLSQNPFSHNVLGALSDNLRDAYVYTQAVSIQDATLPSVEGLLFDTPVSPLIDTPYAKNLTGSNAALLKRARYRTVFLTGRPETWHNARDVFKSWGFDLVIGAKFLAKKYPDAQTDSRGIGDKWVFRYAREMLAAADKRGEKLFLFILTASNHAPYEVPDGEDAPDLGLEGLHPTILGGDHGDDDRAMMKTFYYAADAFGTFLTDIRRDGLLKKTLVAAAGDHNSRFAYRQTDDNFHHQWGVPVMFWVPERLKGVNRDSGKWVGHRDIFPTILELAVGRTAGPSHGVNVLRKRSDDFTTLYNAGLAFSFSRSGAVKVDVKGKLRCYLWDGDRLAYTERCTPQLLQTADETRAQRAVNWHAIRTQLKKRESALRDRLRAAGSAQSRP